MNSRDKEADKPHIVDQYTAIKDQRNVGWLRYQQGNPGHQSSHHPSLIRISTPNRDDMISRRHGGNLSKEDPAFSAEKKIPHNNDSQSPEPPHEIVPKRRPAVNPLTGWVQTPAVRPREGGWPPVKTSAPNFIPLLSEASLASTLTEVKQRQSPKNGMCQNPFIH